MAVDKADNKPVSPSLVKGGFEKNSSTDPTREDIKASTHTGRESVDKQKKEAIDKANLTRSQVEANGRSDFFKLRSQWSSWIIAWISILLSFNVFLTISIGLNWLSFQDYHWFIISVVVQNFLQIVGLGYVAVKFLFSHQSASSDRGKRPSE